MDIKVYVCDRGTTDNSVGIFTSLELLHELKHRRKQCWIYSIFCLNDLKENLIVAFGRFLNFDNIRMS